MGKQVRGFGRGAAFYTADGEVDEDAVRAFVRELLSRTTIDPDEPKERTRPLDEEALEQRWGQDAAEGRRAVSEAARGYVADRDAQRATPDEVAQIRERAYGRAIARQLGLRARDAEVVSTDAHRAGGQR